MPPRPHILSPPLSLKLFLDSAAFSIEMFDFHIFGTVKLLSLRLVILAWPSRNQDFFVKAQHHFKAKEGKNSVPVRRVYSLGYFSMSSNMRHDRGGGA